MRPGFLGKWIEFTYHDKKDSKEVLEMIRTRHM